MKSPRMMLFVAAATLVALGGCRDTRLDTRTFALAHLPGAEAARLVDPYIYGDRPDARGSVSFTDDAITIRETPDNLDRIARVLEQFDKPVPDLRLRFQLIEADGFTEHDPRIAGVEEQLRSVFQFGGYRLVGEAVVSAADRSEITQTVQGANGDATISANVYRVGSDRLRLENVSLFLSGRGDVLRTTVNVRPGQTLILGSSPRPGATSTLLLTVKAEEATE